MKKVRLMAALTAATVFITTGCQNDTESKIVGKYEHPALPGQTFESLIPQHFDLTLFISS